MEICIVRLAPDLSTCPLTTAHIFSRWFTTVIMEGLLVSILLLSISPHTGRSTFKECILLGLIQSSYLPFGALVYSHAGAVIILWSSINRMERGKSFIPLYSLSGIRMTWMTSQGRWVVVSNIFSPMRDKFTHSSFHKDWNIILCVPILQWIGTPYSILS